MGCSAAQCSLFTPLWQEIIVVEEFAGFNNAYQSILDSELSVSQFLIWQLRSMLNICLLIRPTDLGKPLLPPMHVVSTQRSQPGNTGLPCISSR